MFYVRNYKLICLKLIANEIDFKIKNLVSTLLFKKNVLNPKRKRLL